MGPNSIIAPTFAAMAKEAPADGSDVVALLGSEALTLAATLHRDAQAAASGPLPALASMEPGGTPCRPTGSSPRRSTPEEVVEAIAEEAGVSAPEAARRALGLDKLALDARREVLVIGATKDPASLEVEFTGIAPDAGRQEVGYRSQGRG